MNCNNVGGGCVLGHNGAISSGSYDVVGAGRSPKSPKQFLFDAFSPRDEPQSSKLWELCIIYIYIVSLKWVESGCEIKRTYENHLPIEAKS